MLQNSIRLVLGVACAFAFALACYDPKDPSLPQCNGTEQWPHPCAAARADAGAEAGDR